MVFIDKQRETEWYALSKKDNYGLEKNRVFSESFKINGNFLMYFIKSFLTILWIVLFSLSLWLFIIFLALFLYSFGRTALFV